jgi:hypothetical protein
MKANYLNHKQIDFISIIYMKKSADLIKLGNLIYFPSKISFFMKILYNQIILISIVFVRMQRVHKIHIIFKVYRISSYFNYHN